MKWYTNIEPSLRTVHETLIDQLDRIDLKKHQLDAIRPLKQEVLNKINEQLSLEWTYNSNAIEGNTLSLNETKFVLETGFTVKGKSLKDHLEVTNHNNALQFLFEIVQDKAPISESEIRSMHKLVLQSIESEYAGKYREVPVRIVGASFTPPSPFDVGHLMQDFVTVSNEIQDVNQIIKAAVLHHRFTWIHPFFDGNGRTARLVTNLMLMRKGIPPAIVLKADRKKYYSALRLADKGNFEKLVLIFAQAVERSIDIFLNASPKTFQDYQAINDIVSEPEVPYGAEYVSLLASSEKIDAYKEGNQWYTSKKAVLSYMSKRKRKR